MESTHGDTLEHTRRASTAGMSMFTWVLIAFWGLFVCMGFAQLNIYQHSSGQLAVADDVWPETSQLLRPANLPVLVLLLHPQCSCSRATLHELETILAQAPDKFVTYALFSVPESTTGSDAAWRDSDLWRRAKQLPNVTPTIDENGREARLFGAYTSGQALVYGSDGKLIFNGGITASRGHEGDNLGQQTLIRLFNSGEIETSTTSVFGCNLVRDSDSLQRQLGHDRR